MQSSEQTTKLFQQLNWVEAEDQRMLLVRNYDPSVQINTKAKVEDDVEGVPKILTKRVKDVKFEDLKKKDIFHHTTHGLIKVKEIVIPEGSEKRTSVVSFAFQDGKTNKELKYELTDADMKDLRREIEVEVKIHYGNCESQTQNITVPTVSSMTVADFLQPISALTKQGFNLFSNGATANPKTRALNLMKNGSKLLLFSTGEGGGSRPEGPRKFVRFPTHLFTEEFYVSTNDQSICFIPNEDVFLIGFGFYRHYYDHIDTIQLRTTVRIHDSADSALISEHPLTHYYVKYSEIEIDANKIQWYDHCVGQGCEPIKVLAGQHMHVTTMYYHMNTGERFFSGRNGSQYATADNMDMDVWQVKESRYSTYLTNLEQGLIPGIIYKFA